MSGLRLARDRDEDAAAHAAGDDVSPVLSASSSVLLLLVCCCGMWYGSLSVIVITGPATDTADWQVCFFCDAMSSSAISKDLRSIVNDGSRC
mmetsp:Transcript_28844/g.44843  ORF Transcript_28844/g.44843 Transcript_28844/m.44843 type:complete len:92 (+) Transcript_28844:1043-1318(+)